MNTKLYKSIINFALATILIYSCRDYRNNNSEQLNTQIPSLKQNYPLLLSSAKQWSEDAYLHSASVYFNDSQLKISAGFQSPSKDRQSLLITVLSDQSIKSEIIEHPSLVIQQKPILDTDWEIDSNDAVERIVKQDNEAFNFLISHSKHCSDIKLERFNLDENQPVVWSLGLFDCNHETLYFYMDPKSGEILPLSRSISP